MSIKTYVNVGDLVTFQKYMGKFYWARVTLLDPKYIHMESLYTPINSIPQQFKTTVFSKVESIPPYVIQAIRDKIVQEL